MLKIYTKISICLLIPVLTGCQWHNGSWSARNVNLQASTAAVDHQAPRTLSQVAPNKPIGLAEAITRGLMFNADYRSKALLRQVQAAQLGQGPFSLFPKIYANGDYSIRTNKDASVSARVTPTEQPRSTDHFTAVDQSRGFAAIEATWNILDLGLSALNRKIAASEAQAKNANWLYESKRLSTEIIRAFWRLHTHQTHHQKSKKLAEEVNRTLANLKKDQKDPDKKAASLFLMREITDIYRYLLSLERAIADAPAVMNNLLELPQTTKLNLRAKPLTIAFPSQSPTQWIEKALVHSPELNNAHTALFKQKIEAKRDIVSLLPSITAALGIRLDTNSFLLNGDWLTMGVRGSWNLLRLLELPKIKHSAEAKKHYQTQLVSKVASLVARQSVIANVQLKNARTEMRYAQSALKIQRDIVTVIANQVKKKEQPESILVKEKLILALSSIRHGLARAELETAKARMAEIHGFGPALPSTGMTHPTHETFEILLGKIKAFYEAPKA